MLSVVKINKLLSLWFSGKVCVCVFYCCEFSSLFVCLETWGRKYLFGSYAYFD